MRWLRGGANTSCNVKRTRNTFVPFHVSAICFHFAKCHTTNVLVQSSRAKVRTDTLGQNNTHPLSSSEGALCSVTHADLPKSLLCLCLQNLSHKSCHCIMERREAFLLLKCHYICFLMWKRLGWVHDPCTRETKVGRSLAWKISPKLCIVQ